MNNLTNDKEKTPINYKISMQSNQKLKKPSSIMFPMSGALTTEPLQSQKTSLFKCYMRLRPRIIGLEIFF